MFCQEELEHDGDFICFQSLEGFLRFSEIYISC